MSSREPEPAARAGRAARGRAAPEADHFVAGSSNAEPAEELPPPVETHTPAASTPDTERPEASYPVEPAPPLRRPMSPVAGSPEPPPGAAPEAKAPVELPLPPRSSRSTLRQPNSSLRLRTPLPATAPELPPELPDLPRPRRPPRPPTGRGAEASPSDSPSDPEMGRSGRRQPLPVLVRSEGTSLTSRRPASGPPASEKTSSRSTNSTSPSGNTCGTRGCPPASPPHARS